MSRPFGSEPGRVAQAFDCALLTLLVKVWDLQAQRPAGLAPAGQVLLAERLTDFLRSAGTPSSSAHWHAQLELAHPQWTLWNSVASLKTCLPARLNDRTDRTCLCPVVVSALPPGITKQSVSDCNAMAPQLVICPRSATNSRLLEGLRLVPSLGSTVRRRDFTMASQVQLEQLLAVHAVTLSEKQVGNTQLTCQQLPCEQQQSVAGSSAASRLQS